MIKKLQKKDGVAASTGKDRETQVSLKSTKIRILQNNPQNANIKEYQNIISPVVGGGFNGEDQRVTGTTDNNRLMKGSQTIDLED